MPCRCVKDATASYRRILATAARRADPTLRLTNRWIVRRLAPDSVRMDIATLPRGSDPHRLLAAMGRELANIHAGLADERGRFLADQPAGWLDRASDAAVALVLADFAAFRDAGQASHGSHGHGTHGHGTHGHS
jgi:hypothetical protein